MALGEEPPSMARWSSGLPAGILAAVLGRLPSHADRVRFAAVCRPWRAAARAEHPPPPLPWLALPDGTFFSFPGSSEFRFPDAARFHGSCDDWLVFERDYDGGYLLTNPFSGDTMRLPSLSCIRHVVPDGARPSRSVTLGITDDERPPRETSLRKMVMCPRQVVAAIVGDRRRGMIAICRPGTYRWLISAHDTWRDLRDIAFYDGKVYAVDDCGHLCARAVGEDARTGKPVLSVANRVIATVRRCHMPSTRYLVVSGGRLLMVHRVLRSDATSEFAVSKADLTSSRWVDVPGVGGDTAIFVSRWSSVARRVSRYAMPGNRIHFLDDDVFSRHYFAGYPFVGDHFGAYDTRDGRTYPLLPPLELYNDSYTPATWLFPRENGVFRWRDLPLDVLGQVMRLLPPSGDQRLRLTLVCHDWRASVRRNQSRHAPDMAHLALPNGRVIRYPDLKSHLFKDCASFSGAACDDWLLFDDGGGDVHGVLRLTSPLTGKTRLLPSLFGIHAWHEPIEIENEPAPKGGPSEWRDTSVMAVQKLLVCPDGLIAAIVGREYFAKVALCSLDTFSWSFSTCDRWRWYEDIAFSDGKVYALTGDEDLLAFDVGIDATTGNAVVSHVKRVIQSSLPRQPSAKVRYLVRSLGGALLMVRRHFLLGETTVRFSVFRADLRSSQWMEVSTLGGDGEALFVGRPFSKAVRARGAVRGDQIFFLQDEGVPLFADHRRDGPGHHAGVYDMRDGMFTDILPRQMCVDGGAPTTWLFRDARRVGLDSDHDE